jgi:SPP1 family holin
MNTENTENTKITTGTIIRTIVLVLALINQMLVSSGHSILPITDDQITEYVTLAFTIGTALWGYWKNNSFTKEAIAADKYMNELKENA